MRTSSITARMLRVLHGWAARMLRVLHGWAARMLRVLHGWAARMLCCIPSRRLLGVRSRWLGLTNRGRYA